MLTWEELQALAARELQSRAALEGAVAQAGNNVQLRMRLARACVRDNKLVEALGHYERAERLGHADAYLERRLVAQRVGDFLDPGSQRTI